MTLPNSANRISGRQLLLKRRWATLFTCYVPLLVIAGARHVCAQREMHLPFFADYINNNNSNTNDSNNNNAIHTEYVDRNNMTILSMFNLTKADIFHKFTNTNESNSNDSNSEQRNTEYFQKVKEYRLNDIRYRLESAFNASNSEESQEPLLHEMAAYPICGTETNESNWVADNNVTIRFSDSLFEAKNDQLSLDSAILRLYKLNPNARNPSGSGGGGRVSSDGSSSKKKRCDDAGNGDEHFLDSQVRVTVSIVQQMRRNKRERKKRICNTVMMNMSKTGWVEIDIKRAIYIWENIEHQHQMRTQSHQGRNLVGWLMIEVHDEEERPLKPGLFFSPPKCDQADLAIPWNYYGPHAALSTSAADQVPKCPRLDVTLTGYATWAAPHSSSTHNNNKNYSNHLQKKLPRSIQQHQQLIDYINAIGGSGNDGRGVGLHNSPLIAALRPSQNDRKRYHQHEHEQRIPNQIFTATAAVATVADA